MVATKLAKTVQPFNLWLDIYSRTVLNAATRIKHSKITTYNGPQAAVFKKLHVFGIILGSVLLTGFCSKTEIETIRMHPKRNLDFEYSDLIFTNLFSVPKDIVNNFIYSVAKRWHGNRFEPVQRNSRKNLKHLEVILEQFALMDIVPNFNLTCGS